MKTNKYYFLLFYLIFFSYPFSVLSKNDNAESKSQLTVEADLSLEWFEKEKYYLAKGNVLLTKDGLKLNANKVKANYEEKKGENVLKKIIAEGNITLTKGKVKATGQFMTYDVEKKIALMSGSFQTFSSPSGYIESNKVLMFNDTNNKAEAIGKVKIILANKTKIYADNIKADFTGKEKTLKKAIAKGNVIIVNNTKGRKSKANLGIYNSSNETIKLKGNVVIINQNSKIIGSQGITNIKTGISTLTSDPDKPMPFEQAPQYTEVNEAVEHYFEMFTQEKIYEGILNALVDDVSIMEIVKPLLFQGFQEGLFNPDMMLLLAEPLTYIIAALAEQADIDFTIMGDADEYPETEQDKLPEINKALKKVDGTEEPENFPDEIAEKLKNVTPPQRSLLGEK